MKKNSHFLKIFTLVFLIIAGSEIMWMKGLQPLELNLSDYFVRLHAQNILPDNDIVIVNIDDASLARMEGKVGSWFWPRSVHAEMIAGISKQKPKAIVFDLSFVERDLYRPESDALFNQALADKDNIFFALVRLPAEQDSNGPELKAIADKVGLIRTSDAVDDARAALMPPLAIDPKYWRVGSVNFVNDNDGVGRNYDVYQNLYGWLLPSLPAKVVSDLGYPVPTLDEIILSWRGQKNPYQRLSYADLYDDFNREKSLRSSSELTDKIVVIGADASALHDIRVTPIDSLYSGLDILATAIDNLKNQRYMKTAPAWAYLLFCLISVIIVSQCFRFKVNAIVVGGSLLGGTLLSLLASYLLLDGLILLHMLTPLLLIWLYYFTLELREYLIERQSRKRTIELFSRFVNPLVVNELVSNEGLSREGESRQVSVLFSDIRGFTSLSENRTPQEVVNLLNRYFTLQVAVVFKHGGSLDKFIGDCIMAFWGAPLDDEEHAKHAVDAALEMAQVLQEFKQELGQQDADFDVGIGIHSGPAVVGLIGSDQRKEYTAIGDTVNLASRIEGLTKGVSRILVSRDTMDLCHDHFDFKPFGSFKVKGRAQDVELFSPGERGLNEANTDKENSVEEQSKTNLVAATANRGN
ncbi:adenylate/guanylate cyclase domain-containing protein [Shewanella sp. UCD-KL12]|uniref:adenylate/guanylate cyclase domain-containing protein n=1 Tax=Shewanella sp. UCD-KL12 TaxID=1917163 RepID=UPI0009FAF7F8|nr:adenylate/guanylate cyclase domain-containing protein [Shewanella sp. UCD-KL12]